MRKQDNTLVIVLAIIIAILLFGGFGMMGFGGMMGNWGMGGMMGYGNNYLCSQVGGLWCYMPIFSLFFMLLFWVVIILLIVWVVKQINLKDKKR